MTLPRLAAGRRSLAVPVAFLAVFFVWPLATILSARAVGGAPCVDVLTDPGLRSVAWFTLWQAALSHGAHPGGRRCPMAYVVARFRFPGRRARAGRHHGAVRAARPWSSARPSSPCCPTEWHGTVAAIVVAHVFFNYAVVVRTVAGLWAHLDPRLEDAARVLGASRWRVLCEVDAAAAATGDRGRGVDRVPLHVHVVRGGAAARRAAAPDPRGGDLPAHRAGARPRDRGGAGRAAARVPRRAARGGGRARRSARPSPCGCRPAAETSDPARARPASGRSLAANLGVFAALIGRAARPAGRAVLRHTRRLRPRLVPGPRPAGPRRRPPRRPDRRRCARRWATP